MKHTQWYFLLGTITLYLICIITNTTLAKEALIFFKQTIIKIVPLFAGIFVLMIITNYFIKPKKLVKQLKKRGTIIAIITGILSTGPIYMWYPLLKDLKEKGVNDNHIALFLYNRAIKIPLLPLIIGYFGITYTLILTITTIAVSLLQGWLTQQVTRRTP